MSRDDATTDATDERPEPRPAQRTIIESDDYPMRVLAGAGTGKTFTMVRKIERLLDAGVAPNRVLALTFTNKAAASMREKLVERVGPEGHDVEAYTYHAVCHELLQEFAYHADVDPRYDIATDADRLAIAYDVLDEMPYRFTDPDVYQAFDYGTGAVDRLLGFVQVMKRAGITPVDLRAYLVSPGRLIDLEAVVEQVEAAVEDHLRVGWRSMSADRVAEMQANLAAFGDELRTERDRLADEGMEADLARYLVAMEDAGAALAAFFEEEADAIAGGAFPAVQKLPAHLFGSYSNAPKGMPSLAVQLPDTLAQFLDDCQTVSDLVPGYEAYQRRLAEEDLLDFNDLVLKTVALLDDETVDEWLTGQYDYVFCDEYQDTDTVQFELVRRLVSDDRLFVVGDDDQAIYEWRGANVENIGPRLADAYPDLHHETLEENFRSRQPILDLANDALEHLDERGSDKQLRAVDEKADATSGVVTIAGEEEPGAQATQVTSAITRLVDGTTDLADESYAPGEIAILVRKKRHARPIAEALAEAGIPYELAGDLAAESVGVETVVAGLKALANPDDEVSLNRLLRMRYRLHEADLRRLNVATTDADPDEATDETAGEDEDLPLQAALLRLPLASFEEPDRVQQAREDLQELWSLRSTYSLSRLYRELKTTLDLEWFLSEQERRDLRRLDELIESFDEGGIEPELSGEFTDFLARHGSVSAGSSRSMEEQPEPAVAAVSIMTVHESKGLEFPVVVLPRLEAGEWEPGVRTHDRLEHALTGGNPAAEAFVRRDAREQRRLLHVGITRAEELSILVGRDESDDADDKGDADDRLAADTVDEIIGDAVPWSATGVSFPVWQTIQASLPPSAVDGTETLAAPVEPDARIAAIEDGRQLARPAARRRVFELARAMLAGDLPAVDPGRSPVDPAVLGEAPDVDLVRRHSYTSLDALATCTRQHYLDYVLRASDDPVTTVETGESTGEPSTRVVGVVFHETAERAVERGYETPAEWKRAADRIAAARGHRDAIDRVYECIDRYFACEVSGWTALAAERDFEIELDGHAVVGQIDALCRTADGELVVIDYKATDHERSLDSDLQLPIYVLACRDLFDQPVRTAGYAYVGSIGPAIETRTFSDGDLQAAKVQLRERVQAAETSTYEEYQAGDHCQWCPHRSLPCSDDAGL